jgi:hypothetical protein
VFGSVTACYVASPDGTSALTLTPATGRGVGFGGDVGIGGLVSNARTVKNLDGWFNHIEGSGAIGLVGASAGFDWGTASDGQHVWAVTGLYSGGLSASFGYGGSYTLIGPILW